MIFRIQVEYQDKSKDPWWEIYDNPRVINPTKWGQDTVERFNNTLHPGERSRRFLKAEKVTRLFLPVTFEVFSWYYKKIKNFELKRYGQKWTEKHIYRGRPVEISRGYNKRNRMCGKIGKVVIGSMEKIFIKIPFKEIIPIAKTEIFALSIINKTTPISERYIAFEITYL